MPCTARTHTKEAPLSASGAPNTRALCHTAAGHNKQAFGVFCPKQARFWCCYFYEHQKLALRDHPAFVGHEKEPGRTNSRAPTLPLWGAVRRRRYALPASSWLSTSTPRAAVAGTVTFLL